MAGSIQVRVIDEDKRTVFVGDYSKPVELGRQDKGEPGPYNQRLEGGRWRLVIASLTEDTIPRRYLSLEPVAEGRFRLTNRSRGSSIRLPTGEEIRPNEERELTTPSHLTFNRKVI